MQERLFRFKQFAVKHERSAQHVGMDSILLGCWTQLDGVKRILDAGTGCGLLALICAQRNNKANILGVDIDSPSIEEASENFKNSPWTDRLHANLVDFNKIEHDKFDLIISNPPYFHSGVETTLSPRLMARHIGEFSAERIFDRADVLLNKQATISLILPVEQEERIIKYANSKNFFLLRLSRIKGRPELKPKRVMMQFAITGNKKDDTSPAVEELILYSKPNVPSEEFKALCKDFYLNF